MASKLDKNKLTDRVQSLKAGQKKNSRVGSLADFVGSSDRPLSSNIEAVLGSKIVSQVKIIDQDPRQRAPIAQNARTDFLMKFSPVATTQVSWARKVTATSLGKFYGSMGKMVGGEHPIIAQRKDHNVGKLFDIMSAFEIGLKVKAKGSSERLKLDTASDLSVFMSKALEDVSINALSKAIYGSSISINKLKTQPEKVRLTTLLRVLDQLDISVECYDQRLENENKPSKMAM